MTDLMESSNFLLRDTLSFIVCCQIVGMTILVYYRTLIEVVKCYINIYYN